MAKRKRIKVSSIVGYNDWNVWEDGSVDFIDPDFDATDDYTDYITGRIREHGEFQPPKESTEVWAG